MIGRTAAVLALAVPLLVSVVLYGWSALWNGPGSGPLPTAVHLVLVMVQACLALLLFFAPVLAVVTLATILYGALGVGAALLLLTSGRVRCGCWGSSSATLTWSLVAFDLLLAGVGWALVANGGSAGLPWETSAALVLATASATLFGGVLLPDYLHVLPGAQRRAAPFTAWVAGFPELETVE